MNSNREKEEEKGGIGKKTQRTILSVLNYFNRVIGHRTPLNHPYENREKSLKLKS